MLAVSRWAVPVRFMLNWTLAHFIELEPKHVAQDQPPNWTAGFIVCLICKRLYLLIVMVFSSLLFQSKIPGRKYELKNMYYWRFQGFKAFTSNELSFTIILHVIHFHSERQWLKAAPRITQGVIGRALINLQISWHFVLKWAELFLLFIKRNTILLLSMCTKTIAPVLVSYRRQNLTALCLRIVMFQYIYKSSLCYIPWPFPAEELLITSSDSCWLSYYNTLNMQDLC